MWRHPVSDDGRGFTLTVFGVPAPQGSKSFKGMRGGHAILVESSKKVKPWRAAVKAAAIDSLGPRWAPLEGPIELTVWFYLPRPIAAPKTRRVFPAKMPDLSKLLRSTEDALTDAGAWRDDALVCDAIVHKRYAVHHSLLRIHQHGDFEVPGAIITVRETA
jgi:crossover junction endodeoxyribonuclease RusA